MKTASLLIVLTCTLAHAAPVRVATGELEGVTRDGVTFYKGIPYARPPVGELRWKSPQPPEPWTGVRSAGKFGPSPKQNWLLAAGLTGGLPHMSEDCLYLNVWCPHSIPSGEKLPVMVWIYGGGNTSGSSSFPIYDLANLSRKGVVAVSVNYRVGPFGYLAHPELTRESGHSSGNYGLQDQIAALRWVKENIASFGGDNSRITIFGESAGGVAVSILTVVPEAKGLFHRAICQSGCWMFPVSKGEKPQGPVVSLAHAEQAGRDFFSRLGAADLTAARALSADRIQRAADSMPNAGFGTFNNNADGKLITGDAFSLYQSGAAGNIPMILGTNSDEGAMFTRQRYNPAAFEKTVRERFGTGSADNILKVYPHANDTEAFKSAKDLVRDFLFAWHAWKCAGLVSKNHNNRVWLYYFDPPNPKAPDGADHAAEIPFVLRNVSKDPAAIRLSETMSGYWINFARTGNPNGNSLPQWPSYSSTDVSTLILDSDARIGPVPNPDKLQALDSHLSSPAFLKSY